jgi:hypothetical protein
MKIKIKATNRYMRLIKIYNLMPRYIQMLICIITKEGWYGTLVLKSMLYDVKKISKRRVQIQKYLEEGRNDNL